MCGVFGFVSTNGGRCNMKSLKKIARSNEERGRHAWGFSWIGSDGELHMHKETGAISDSLDTLEAAADARILIGHTRYATQGSPLDNNNNHPHAAADGYIVHNGMIPNYRRLFRQYDLEATTDCDSEVLARLIEKSEAETLLKRCIYAAQIASGMPLVMLGIWKPNCLTAIRNGNPLWKSETKTGMYLSSLDDYLPGLISEFPNKRGMLFRAEVDASIRKEACV